ncbi:hypothetical protein Tco_0522344 [Tanacetum coccineum]
MHNNIMVAGSRDRPPMLAMGKYAQWQSCFMRYVDTKPNGVETFLNISPENNAHYDAEKEAIHLVLTRIGDEIYSNVDACKTAHDIWIAIERLQQGESLNKQDVKTSLFWEFGRFTSRDRESIKSYYSRFYKMMNEMQTVDLDKGSYHKLFDILKQYQKEVNEIRAEDIAKNANPLALVIYKPTNNNLKTSSNSRNKNVDTTPRYVNKNQIGQFGNQRTVTVAGSRETVGSQVVQQTGIQCFNCKEFRYFAKECKKPKRAKDYTYHKEKMLLCKQAEKGVPLQADQADWIENTHEEIDEQELEAHYSFMEKIQEVLPVESGSDAEPLEKVQYDVEYNVFANERQHSEQPENPLMSHVVEKDDKCKSALEECKSSLGESNRTRDRYLVALHDKEVELEKYKIFKDCTIENDTLERKFKETLGLLAQKEYDIQEGLEIKAYEVSIVKEKHDELVKQGLLTKSSYEGLVKEKNKVIKDLKLKEEKDLDKLIAMKIPYDKCDLANLFAPNMEETLTLEQESRSKLNKDLVKPYDYTKQNNLYEIFKPPSWEYLDQLTHANEIRRKM